MVELAGRPAPPEVRQGWPAGRPRSAGRMAETRLRVDELRRGSGEPRQTPGGAGQPAGRARSTSGSGESGVGTSAPAGRRSVVGGAASAARDLAGRARGPTSRPTAVLTERTPIRLEMNAVLAIRKPFRSEKPAGPAARAVAPRSGDAVEGGSIALPLERAAGSVTTGDVLAGSSAGLRRRTSCLRRRTPGLAFEGRGLPESRMGRPRTTQDVAAGSRARDGSSRCRRGRGYRA